MDAALLGLALTLGLTANFFCAGTCLPVLAPYIMGRTDGVKGGLRLGLWFTLGRLPLYLVLGAAFSFAGGELVEDDAVTVTIVMRLALAAAIIAYGAATAFRWRMPKVCMTRKGGTAIALVLGALVGSVACPPFMLLLAELFLEGDATMTAAAVVVFWAASSLLLLTAAVISGGAARGLNSRWEEGKLREVMGMVLMMVGGLYIWTILTAL